MTDHDDISRMESLLTPAPRRPRNAHELAQMQELLQLNFVPARSLSQEKRLCELRNWLYEKNRARRRQQNREIRGLWYSAARAWLMRQMPRLIRIGTFAALLAGWVLVLAVYAKIAKAGPCDDGQCGIANEGMEPRIRYNDRTGPALTPQDRHLPQPLLEDQVMTVSYSSRLPASSPVFLRPGALLCASPMSLPACRARDRARAFALGVVS